MLKNHFYDVCCLDRMLPSMDGLTVLKNARAAKIATPVLMLTALARIDDRVDGLEAGADDYLAKPFDMRELIARLRALVRRPATVTAHDHLNFEDITLDPFELCLTGPSGTQTLSKKESEVLEALIKCKAKIMPRETLLSHVWGMDTEVEETNLNTYVHFVRRRLEQVGSSVQITTVRGIGYRMEKKPC